MNKLMLYVAAPLVAAIFIATVANREPDPVRQSITVAQQNTNDLEKAKQQIAEAMQDPDKVRLMECIGVNPWKVKPNGWTPPTKRECAALEQKLGDKAGPKETLAATSNPSPPKNVALLMEKEAILNDKCRGGAGGEVATFKACDERDMILTQIEAKGWCWGHEGQAGYERTWEPCNSATAKVKPLNVTLDLNVTFNGQNTFLNVTTNLPPMTQMMATLVNPINTGGSGFLAQANSIVQTNQSVRFGPFTNKGNRLPPGTYVVTITSSLPALQPAEVMPYLGIHGEYLTGNLILTRAGEKFVSQTFKVKI